MIPLSNEKALELQKQLMYPLGYSHSVGLGSAIIENDNLWDEKQAIGSYNYDDWHANNESIEIMQEAERDAYNALLNQIQSGSYNDIDSILSALQRENDAYQAYITGENSIARQWASNEAKLAREWEEKMSNTAYQRAFSDMKAAGLNPFAFALGSGSSISATTPSASPASSSFQVASRPNNIRYAIDSFLNTVDTFSQSAYREGKLSLEEQKIQINAVVNLLGSFIRAFASISSGGLF